jgi:hypothetical protein
LSGTPDKHSFPHAFPHAAGSCAPDHRFRAVVIVLRLRAGRLSAYAPARPSGAARAERTVVEMDNQAEITRATEGA